MQMSSDTFILVIQGVFVVMLIVTFIQEIIRCSRETNEEEQRARPVVVHQGAALAALEDRRTTATARQPAEVLPFFPYAAQGRASETLCAICVEPLPQGKHCSEVPACRHAFHRDCLGVWARRKSTCPLCRAKIAPGFLGAEVDVDVA